MEDLPFNETTYKSFLNQNRLMGMKCRDCGDMRVPPQPLCPSCRSTDLELLDLSGRGTLKTFTIITVAPPDMAARGYGPEQPYCTGVVSLAEGCAVVARIEGLNLSDPESIRIGTEMKAGFLHQGEAEELDTVLTFEPA